MLRVLVGENETKDILVREARKGRAISWIVPKDSQPGDDAVFLFNRSQFLATGVIERVPVPVLFGKRATFRADVGELELLPRAVDLEEVKRVIPEWQWLRYPRSYATPSPRIASRLSALLRDAGRLHGTRSGSKTTGTPPRATPARKLSRPTLDAIVDEQVGDLELAPEGRKVLRTHVETERNPSNRRAILRIRASTGALACDGCGGDLGAMYGADYAEVLEVHHRVPLRKGLQTPKGTDAFALLCPTCHRVVHHRQEIPLAVDDLQRLLRQGKERP